MCNVGRSFVDRIRSEIGSEIQEGKSIVAKLVIIRLIELPEISRTHQRVVPRLFYTERLYRDSQHCYTMDLELHPDVVSATLRNHFQQIAGDWWSYAFLP